LLGVFPRANRLLFLILSVFFFPRPPLQLTHTQTRDRNKLDSAARREIVYFGGEADLPGGNPATNDAKKRSTERHRCFSEDLLAILLLLLLLGASLIATTLERNPAARNISDIQKGGLNVGIEIHPTGLEPSCPLILTAY
jgi:hypothetical protein